MSGESVAEKDLPARPGQILLNKYEVEQVLGVGGMGVVVAARHLQLQERVALKFLLPSAAAQSDAVARFLREARAVVRLRSEHVTRVMDVGTLENGAPYIVMEYLDGHDLASVLAQSPAGLPVPEVVDYVLQACEALAEAHSLGIVHRDLKPANLFLTRRADRGHLLKVLDFGISKNTQGDFQMTKTSAVMGSPLYMSPEQMRSSRDVDPRSDIWALGVVLHELVTGQPPYEAETMPELVARVLTEPPNSLTSSAPHVPASFEAVVLRCMAKDPNQRYQTVLELARALAPFAANHGAISIERIRRVLHGKAVNEALGMAATVPSVPPLGSTTAMSASAVDQSGRSERSRRGVWVAVSAAAVVLFGGLFSLITRAGGSEPVTAPALHEAAAARPLANAPLLRQPEMEPVAAPVVVVPSAAVSAAPATEAPAAKRVVRPRPATPRESSTAGAIEDAFGSRR